MNEIGKMAAISFPSSLRWPKLTSNESDDFFFCQIIVNIQNQQRTSKRIRIRSSDFLEGGGIVLK